MNWEIRTYRVEWLAECGMVDQYGQNFQPYDTVVRPSQEAAEIALREIAHPHPYVSDRWVPNDAPHSYVEARVCRRERLIQKGWLHP